MVELNTFRGDGKALELIKVGIGWAFLGDSYARTIRAELIKIIDAIDTFSISGIKISTSSRYIEALPVNLILPCPTIYFLVNAFSIIE